MQVLLILRPMLDLGARYTDVYDIVDGGGGNNKKRLELNDGRCMVRRAQGHSVGSGVRPDFLPVAEDLNYITHGTILEAEKIITQSGLSRCQLLHVHFYESDKKGDVSGWNTDRCGSDVGIVVSARQCMGDGIVVCRSVNNVILTEWISGVVGVQYFRFIHRLHRDPCRKRTILRQREGRAGEDSEESEDHRPKPCSREQMSKKVIIKSWRRRRMRRKRRRQRYRANNLAMLFVRPFPIFRKPLRDQTSLD